MQKFEITAEEQHQRFDKYLKRHLSLAPSSFLYKMLRKKNITLNGRKADGSEQLELGDIVTLFLSDETYAKFSGITEGSTEKSAAVTGYISPQEGQIRNKRAEYLAAYHHLEKTGRSPRIIFEDEDYLFADKPAGLLSQKADPQDESLNEWFLGYLVEKGFLDENSLVRYTPSVCNRLDRNTSGIVICAKTLAGSQLMASMLRERTIHKYYHLIAVGRTQQKGVIENLLIRNRQTNMVSVTSGIPGQRDLDTEMPGRNMPYADKSGQGMAAKTCYHLLMYHKGQDLSYVEAQLITGKTHQLRAHFASIGHPILGDVKYGDAKANSRFRSKGVRRQMLHCSRIAFPDAPDIIPYAFRRYRGRIIQSPDPAIFSELLQ